MLAIRVGLGISPADNSAEASFRLWCSGTKEERPNPSFLRTASGGRRPLNFVVWRQTVTEMPHIPDRRQRNLEACANAVDFFSARNKPLRERWVCQELLRCLGVEFADSEVVSAADEPPDVVFRDARFEIKEILDPGRRRHSEYKQALIKASVREKADVPQRGYTPKDITPAEVSELVQMKLSELESHYPPAVKAQLDALFYVNLTEHWLAEGPMPDPATFPTFGWRSVSAVFGGRHSLVFAGTGQAPEFLRSMAGQAFTTGETDA